MIGQVILQRSPGNWKEKELTWTTIVFWFFRSVISENGVTPHCETFVARSLYFYFFFVVSIQGEVEQISLMKPKAQGPHDEGFLEYLEDIIGTNQYVEKIEDSYKQ